MTRRKKPQFVPDLSDSTICGVPVRELIGIARMVNHYQHLLYTANSNQHLIQIERIIDEWAEENRKIIPKATDIREAARNVCRKQYMRCEVMESLIGYLYAKEKEELDMIKQATEEAFSAQVKPSSFELDNDPTRHRVEVTL